MKCKYCQRDCVLMSMMEDEYCCTRSDHEYTVIYDEGENVVAESMILKKESENGTSTLVHVS